MYIRAPWAHLVAHADGNGLNKLNNDGLLGVADQPKYNMNGMNP
jgi:hypothetical protein